MPNPEKSGLQIVASDTGEYIIFKEAQEQQSLAMAARLVLKNMEWSEPDAVMTIKSQLPIAAGMGSGAAVTVAIIQSLECFFGKRTG